MLLDSVTCPWLWVPLAFTSSKIRTAGEIELFVHYSRSLLIAFRLVGCRDGFRHRTFIQAKGIQSKSASLSKKYPVSSGCRTKKHDIFEHIPAARQQRPWVYVPILKSTIGMLTTMFTLLASGTVLPALAMYAFIDYGHISRVGSSLPYSLPLSLWILARISGMSRDSVSQYGRTEPAG